MSKSSLPAWAQEQIAELEAQLGRKVTDSDLNCVDINENGRTMTVARDPLLSEIRSAESVRSRATAAFPELQ